MDEFQADPKKDLPNEFSIDVSVKKGVQSPAQFSLGRLLISIPFLGVGAAQMARWLYLQSRNRTNAEDDAAWLMFVIGASLSSAGIALLLSSRSRQSRAERITQASGTQVARFQPRINPPRRPLEIWKLILLAFAAPPILYVLLVLAIWVPICVFGLLLAIFRAIFP